MKSKATSRVLAVLLALFVTVTSITVGVVAQENTELDLGPATELEEEQGEAQEPQADDVEVLPNLEGLEQGAEPADFTGGSDLIPFDPAGLPAQPTHRSPRGLDGERMQVQRSIQGEGDSFGTQRSLQSNPAVGTVVTMWGEVTPVENVVVPTDFRVIAVGANCVVYLQDDIGATQKAALMPNGSNPQQLARDIADEFDSVIEPLVHGISGSVIHPAGLTTSGKINIVLLDINDKDNSNSGSLYTAGFFYTGDMHSAAQAPGSNEDTIVYIDIARQYGYANLNGQSADAASRASFFGTLAHEYQHLVNYSHYLNNQINGGVSYASGDPDTNRGVAIWLNEGLSGLVDVEYLARKGFSMNTSHLSWFVGSGFARGVGYIPTYSQWAAANSAGYEVLANYGSVSLMMQEYEKLNADTQALVSSNRVGYNHSLENVGNGASQVSGSINNFNDLFEVFVLDTAVSTPPSTVSAIITDNYVPYVSPNKLVYDNYWSLRRSAGGYDNLQPGTATFTSNTRTYYSHLYLADSIGAANNSAVITIPADTNAKYFVITPHNATGINDYSQWENVGKIAAELRKGENTVTVGTDNMFAVVAIAFGSAFNDTVGYQPASSVGLTPGQITPSTSPLFAGASGQQITLPVATAKIADGEELNITVIRNSDEDKTSVSGFDKVSGTGVVNSDAATITIDIPDTAPADLYRVVVEYDGVTASSEAFLLTITAELWEPVDGAVVDADIPMIQFGFTGTVQASDGNVVLATSEGTYSTPVKSDYVSGSGMDARLTIPVTAFRNSDGNIILDYGEKNVRVELDSGAVTYADGEVDVPGLVASFDVDDQDDSAPSVLPATLVLDKGQDGRARVYMTLGYSSASISSDNANIATVDVDTVENDRDIITISGVGVGHTAINVTFTGENVTEVTETINVTVNSTGDGGNVIGGGIGGGSGGSTSRGGGKSGSSTPDGSRSAASSTSTTGPVDKNSAVSSTKAAVTASGNGTGVVAFNNATSISLDTMRAMAAAAKQAGGNVLVRANTFVNGKIAVRISFDPANATKDIELTAYLDTARAQATKAKFARAFNQELAVISCTQQGGFGMTVNIAAKVDLSKLDTSSLYLYSYDKAGNSFKLIENTKYRVDANGYLYFQTDLAGDIVIADAPLTR